MRIVTHLAVCIAVTSCAPKPHLLLTVEAGGGVPEAFETLLVGTSASELSQADVSKKVCPIRVTVTGQAGVTAIWVETRDENGSVLGRGRVDTRLKTRGTSTEVVTLRPACEVEADCDDGRFCSGQETCVDGYCLPGENPCGAASCASAACVDEEPGRGSCNWIVNHSLCNSDEYCHPNHGCIPGAGCDPEYGDADCQDDSFCNGVERCVDYRCEAGTPPVTEDGDPCTTGSCSEAGQAVVQVQDLAKNGRACDLPGNAGVGVCIAVQSGCVASACGDGVRDLATEECDDGNDNDEDGCSNNCKLPGCGDGVRQGTEDCDDGNDNDEDACLNTCVRNTCGDSVLHQGVEQCDDGNDENNDACLFDCTPNTCQDAFRNPAAEECDDGNAVNTDGCLDDCTDNTCGDGFLYAGVEACDDGRHCESGATCSGATDCIGDGDELCRPRSGDGCRNDCLGVEVCGDGTRDPPAEGCDDGNQVNTDSCTAGCKVATCGDGYRHAGVEACDDSNRVGGDGCSADCLKVEVCGDSFRDEGESCDDGTNDGGEGECVSGCLGLQSCGDGVSNGTEACDDGAANRDDWAFFVHCNSTCSGFGPHCGDGIEDGYEECDDGGNAAGCDGCLPGCQATCVCSPEPTYGELCISGVWVPCDNETTCGPDCEPCSGDTPVCGGIEAGCVVEPATGCVGVPDFTPCQVVTVPDRTYDICIDEICVSPGCGSRACNTSGPYFDLPDTNQRLCFNAGVSIPCPGTAGGPGCGSTAYCGQDGQYGWDTQHDAAERFTRTGAVTDEPVVVDNVTGMMWQGCGAIMSGTDCTVGFPGVTDMQGAVTYCDELKWGEFNDWRLPGIGELTSIIDFSRGAAIDDAAFPNTPASSFWSSSASPPYAWYVDVGGDDGGTVSYRAMDEPGQVRCVRNETRPITIPVTRFVISMPVAGQRVVRDDVTGRQWQGCARGQSGADCATGSASDADWQAGLAYCEDLDWGGHTDWYLPNPKELLSIIDYRWYSPAMDTAAFPATPSSSFWTSSTVQWSRASAWRVSAQLGYASTYSKSTAMMIRCVRLGP